MYSLSCKNPLCTDQQNYQKQLFTYKGYPNHCKIDMQARKGAHTRVDS